MPSAVNRSPPAAAWVIFSVPEVTACSAACAATSLISVAVEQPLSAEIARTAVVTAIPMRVAFMSSSHGVPSRRVRPGCMREPLDAR
jgi:hypothetical protein